MTTLPLCFCEQVWCSFERTRYICAAIPVPPPGSGRPNRDRCHHHRQQRNAVRSSTPRRSGSDQSPIDLQLGRPESPGKGSTTLGKFSGSTLQPYSRQTGFFPCIDLKSIQVITGQAFESSRLYLSHNPVCQYRIVSIRVSIIFQGRASLIRRHAVKWPQLGSCNTTKRYFSSDSVEKDRQCIAS
jgi:hypothetical protein